MVSTKKKYLVSSLFLYFLLFVTFIKVKNYSQRTVNRTQKLSDDISCHVKTEGDALPSAEGASFSPPADSIFFHETSCRGGLTSRQACAVESAARAHPGRNIYVLFSGPLSNKTLYSSRNSLTTLKIYPNIEYARVHAQAYAKKTAFQHFVFGRELNASGWKVVHASDMLRFITMYKYGGIYLDTDVIVLKPLDALGINWAVREDNEIINTAVMSVGRNELGRKIMEKVLEEIIITYEPSRWSFNGPDALARVLANFCNTTNVTDYTTDTCFGFQVYGPEVAYHVPYLGFSVLFEPVSQFTEESYAVHLWNSLSEHKEVQIDSPVDRMAQKHCPATYELYEDSFGFY